VNKRSDNQINPHIGTAGFVIEGLYNWIFAMGGSPHICIVANWEGNQLPSTLPVQKQRLENDDGTPGAEISIIVLNLGEQATRGLTFYREGDDPQPHDPVSLLLFSARSKGEHFDAIVDVDSILSAFMLEESGRGMSLGNNPALNEYIENLNAGKLPTKETPSKTQGRPFLKVVK